MGRAGQRRMRWAVTFTLRTPLRPLPPALPPSLPAQDTSTMDMTSFWLAPAANGSVGADLSLLATAEHTCGPAHPLPDTSTGPSSPARVRQEQPLATALDLDPFNPTALGAERKGGADLPAFKITPVPFLHQQLPPASVKMVWKGIWC